MRFLYVNVFILSPCRINRNSPHRFISLALLITHMDSSGITTYRSPAAFHRLNTEPLFQISVKTLNLRSIPSNSVGLVNKLLRCRTQYRTSFSIIKIALFPILACLCLNHFLIPALNSFIASLYNLA